MNTYLCSDGSRVTQPQLERKMRVAKMELIEEQLDSFGYNFCQERKCKRSNGVRLDCSHTISIQHAKNLGKTELCWDKNNMRMLCRSCHQKFDKLNVQFKK